MRKLFKTIGRIVSSFWRGIALCRRFIGNLLFIVIIIFILSLFFYESKPKIPSGAALILSPAGTIVEQRTETVLSNRLFGQAVRKETVLKDIIDVIDAAGADQRVRLLVLDLHEMRGGNISKLQDIGSALARFKSNGKKIIAAADYYSQQQYYLAAYGDKVYLNPMGGILLDGYGMYRKYYKRALEKLKIQFHVFRVGTYKSALEPFMRNNMSTYAKQENLAWLEVWWNAYKKGVAAQRGLDPQSIDDYINNISANLARVKGDTAKLALDYGLIDALKTRDEVRKELVQMVGPDKDDKTYKQISFDDYLHAIRPTLLKTDPYKDKIGLIVAEGIILDGTQPAGKIGGDSLSRLIQKARKNKKIKAVVLRINSGGGSAFASEVIRKQVELTRQAGKPVIVSMGAVAASGGYWMATSANEIWATPTTITGSIGIFGAFATFDNTLNSLGVFTDGVGTTKLSNALDPSRPLNPMVADSMQQIINQGYRRFIHRVSEGRHMKPAVVEKIAQGRVWAGKTALKLGLVDKLGGLRDAVKAAAKHANLKNYEVIPIEQPLTFREKVVNQLNRLMLSFFRGDSDDVVHPVIRLYNAFGRPAEQIFQFNDPYGLYAYCLTCDTQ